MLQNLIPLHLEIISKFYQPNFQMKSQDVPPEQYGTQFKKMTRIA